MVRSSQTILDLIVKLAVGGNTMVCAGVLASYMLTINLGHEASWILCSFFFISLSDLCVDDGILSGFKCLNVDIGENTLELTYSCLDKELICDGALDCLDASDEMNCQSSRLYPYGPLQGDSNLLSDFNRPEYDNPYAQFSLCKPIQVNGMMGTPFGSRRHYHMYVSIGQPYALVVRVGL